MDSLTRLVAEAQRGNLDAFGGIVERFQASARAQAYGVLGDVQLAEDAAQEAFLEAFCSLGQLREPLAFAGWFRRIVLTRADRLRRGKLLSTLSLEQAAATHGAGDPSTTVEARELGRSVHAALETLSEAERLPLVLYYLAGYNQSEIADLLGLQANAVKQRLWQARWRLRSQLGALAPNGGAFAREIKFLLAVRIGDTAAVQVFLEHEPELAQARERWDGQTARRLGLPLAGSLTALHRAAFEGWSDVLRILLACSAEVDARSKGAQTPLHLAVLNGDPANVELLLLSGADPDLRSAAGMSPLHYAVIRRHLACTRLLLAHGARSDLRDRNGHTARDWARLKNHTELGLLLVKAEHKSKEHTLESEPTVPVGDALLGRMLDPHGHPLDGGAPLIGPAMRDTALRPSHNRHRAGAILESGIKAIDFYAPLPRGGVVVIEGRPGTGWSVVTSELVHNLHTRHGGRTVMVVLDAAGRPARELVADLRGAGAVDSTVVVAAAQAEPDAYGEAVRTGLVIAGHFAAAQHECLLVVDEQLLDRRTAELLRGGADGVTMLVWRLIESDEPHAHHIEEPDALVVLRPELGRRMIYPTVDPLASRSRLPAGTIGAIHQQALERIRTWLEQIDIFDASAGPAGAEAGRARRALAFQTQPFSVAELYTARPGVYVDATGTVAGFAAIADGAYDGLAEAELSYIGASPERTS